MSFSKSINQFRRTITRGLTKRIGSANNSSHKKRADQKDIKRIFVSRPNGRLGNLLLISPLLQELSTLFPESKIDLFVKGTIASVLFKNYPSIDQIISLPKKPFKQLLAYIGCWFSIRNKKYDLAINVDYESSSGRLSTQFSKSKFKVFGDVTEDINSKSNNSEHIAFYPVYSLRANLSQLGLKISETPINNLNLKLDSLEIENGHKILSQIVDSKKKTISIFTYATGEKCLTEEWWDDFYQKLISKFPNFNIIEVLPFENISKIGFKAPTFYSKDVREIGSVIANTTLFIGADSGIMHLSSSVGTPTLGLFSVSNLNKYKPYASNSKAIDVTLISTDECIDLVSGLLSKS